MVVQTTGINEAHREIHGLRVRDNASADRKPEFMDQWITLPSNLLREPYLYQLRDRANAPNYHGVRDHTTARAACLRTFEVTRYAHRSIDISLGRSAEPHATN